MKHAPGTIRDAIVEFMHDTSEAVTVFEITDAVVKKLGSVPHSSVRSYLNLNVPRLFERTERGLYSLKPPSTEESRSRPDAQRSLVTLPRAELFQADCFQWLSERKPASVHAVITDPPYGLVEYSVKEQGKLRAGKGGVWRIPPSFDGHRRAPLPRFTILGEEDREALHHFFHRFGKLVSRVLVPGGNVVVASNPLLSHIVASAMAESGLELRGYLARLTMTMRGGDRPKNAHGEFPGVSVMPRSMWEPWVVLRKQPEGRIQDNLRKWKTGGFRRPSEEQPFGDVLRSGPTSKAERDIAPHPSLKPQAFMREVVRAALPLGHGVVLDPFMGAGSTIAAASSLGYESIGVEMDPNYFQIAVKAIPGLASLSTARATSRSVERGESVGATERSKANSRPKGRRLRRTGNSRIGGSLL